MVLTPPKWKIVASGTVGQGSSVRGRDVFLLGGTVWLKRLGLRRRRIWLNARLVFCSRRVECVM